MKQPKVDVASSVPHEKKRKLPKYGQGQAKAISNKPLKDVYAQQVVAPAGKRADQPIMETPEVGKGVPSMVPHETGSFEGPAAGVPKRQPVGAKLGVASNFTPQFHGFGHSGAQKAGKYRLSGHSGAHRIGKK